MAEFRYEQIRPLRLDIHISSQTYQIDTDRTIDISIPLNFHGEQPNAYGVPHATAKTYEDGNFIGDTRRGGSCNFEEYKLVPHCNGTHTESVGHLAFDRISIHWVLQNSMFPATLISVEPVDALGSGDSCRHKKNKEDKLITHDGLTKAIEDHSKEFLEAFIIRTLPNDISKMSRQYLENPPPYFSIEAMQLIVELGVKHLLVDLPSVDRPFDEGKMTAHHIFWNVPEESHEVDAKNHSMKTITEMIYVANEVADGLYFLNLQIPGFVADAAPSRPVLYKLR